jgi:hypothetical protein
MFKVGAWFGALYGFKGVPIVNYEHLEYRQRAETLALKLYHLARKDSPDLFLGEPEPPSQPEVIPLFQKKILHNEEIKLKKSEEKM